MAKIENLVGRVFGYLTVIKYAFSKPQSTCWICKCICGNFTTVQRSDLMSRTTISCGCYRAARLKAQSTIHGFANKNALPAQRRFYSIWRAMQKRCYNTKREFYHRYGGRGITVCGRWLGKDGFINFKEDMWKSYLAHIKEFGEGNTSINRIDNDGNYEPTNCNWQTNSEQSGHRRWSPTTVNLKQHNKNRHSLQTLIGFILRGKRKNSPLLLKYLGCTISEFKQYIESKFESGMTWSNYGRYELKTTTWNIDHTIPCYKFDLSKEKDLLKCFHYTNLQPKWAKQNRRCIV